MAKKAMIDKELKRAKLAAAGKYPTVRYITDAAFAEDLTVSTEISVFAEFV